LASRGMQGEKSSEGISSKRWRTFSRLGLHSVADLSAAHLGTYRRAAGGKHEKAPFLISSMGRAHVSRPFVKDELPQFLSVGRQNLLTAADVSRETSPSFPALIGARNRASCHAAPTIFRVSRDSASDVSRETSLADPRPSSKKVE
jgi:hypothetical protein